MLPPPRAMMLQKNKCRKKLQNKIISWTKSHYEEIYYFLFSFVFFLRAHVSKGPLAAFIWNLRRANVLFHSFSSVVARPVRFYADIRKKRSGKRRCRGKSPIPVPSLARALAGLQTPLHRVPVDRPRLHIPRRKARVTRLGERDRETPPPPRLLSFSFVVCRVRNVLRQAMIDGAEP